MKNLFPILIFALHMFSCGGASSQTPVLLADPFIMLHGNTYYAYGTRSDRGIEVYVSSDLKTWKRNTRLALDKNDSWGERWFWAPEVYYIEGKFYMYYSADEHICVATSDSPLGPFVQNVQKPMIEEEKCIDSSLFIDTDGKPYMFFDRFNDGLNIWVAELTADLLEVKPTTMRKCISMSQKWETVWPKVNEGVFVIENGGTYYMIYSANSYESQSYGIGLATATSVWGPWKKYGGNPILQKPGSLVGTGHAALFTDKNDELRIVFHAHHDKQNIHPRQMHIGKVNFKTIKDAAVLAVDEGILTPTLKQP